MHSDDCYTGGLRTILTLSGTGSGQTNHITRLNAQAMTQGKQ